MIASEITFDTIRDAAFEMVKGDWRAISAMLGTLTDEEIDKIPTIDDDTKKVAEKYGLCDYITKDAKSITIYAFWGYIMRGETIYHNNEK